MAKTDENDTSDLAIEDPYPGCFMQRLVPGLFAFTPFGS